MNLVAKNLLRQLLPVNFIQYIRSLKLGLLVKNTHNKLQSLGQVELFLTTDELAFLKHFVIEHVRDKADEQVD